MNTHTAINTYAKVGLESGVASADPHKLILLLYQGTLLAIATAKNQMLRKETLAKGTSISKAITIIDEGLKASLDVSAGGDLAQNLSGLYDYMSQRLLIANLKNDPAILDEISRLLNELKSAWEAIRPAVMPATAPAESPKTPVSGSPGSSYGIQSNSGKQALTYGRL